MLLSYILIAAAVAFVVTRLSAADKSLDNSDLAMILASSLVWPVGLAVIFGYVLGDRK